MRDGEKLRLTRLFSCFLSSQSTRWMRIFCMILPIRYFFLRCFRGLGGELLVSMLGLRLASEWTSVNINWTRLGVATSEYNCAKLSDLQLSKCPPTVH